MPRKGWRPCPRSVPAGGVVQPWPPFLPDVLADCIEIHLLDLGEARAGFAGVEEGAFGD